VADSFFRDQGEEPGDPVAPTEAVKEEEPKLEAESDELLEEEDRIAAVMSYIPFLCFVPLVNVNWRDNKKARFHARQGVILFLIELASALFLIDDLSKFVFRAVLLLAAALAAVGIYFALQGKSLRLPFISDIADKAKL
jgi:uncharacterized membrane protein